MDNRNHEFINYYRILEIEQNASGDEIKKNYQRLALQFHPDKSDGNQDKFLMVQKAWLVLRDPKSRKHYDAVLSCYENSEVLLYDTISLSDMNFDQDNEVYTYGCRCGGIYYLESNVDVSPHFLINCNECSFSIQVNM